MNFSLEQLLNLIQQAQTLDEAQRTDWRIRIFAEWKAGNGQLPAGLRNELADLFEAEVEYLETHELPTLSTEHSEATDAYHKEVESIRPALGDLVRNYTKETEELVESYKKESSELQRKLDELAQQAKGEKEAADISALRAQLKTQPSTKTQ